MFHERRRSSAARWSRRVAVFAAVLLVTAGLGHRWALVDSVPFFWVLGVVVALAVVALILAGSGFSQLWKYGDKGGRDSTWAAIVALLVLVPFLVSGYRIAVHPFLSDISTDLTDPPQLLRAAARRTPAMNAIGAITPEAAELQRRNYPEITGRRYDVPADRVREAIDTVVAGYGWPVIDPGRTNLPDQGTAPEITMELTACTFWLCFPVDIAIRITDEGETSYVDMRSAARYARHDFGDNAQRITGFFEALDTEVAGKVAVAPAEQ